MLSDVPREREIKRPSQGDTHFPGESRQLGEVDRPPQPPSQKTGEAQAENFRHSGAMPNRCKLPQSREAKRRWLRAAKRSGHVFRATHRFAQGVLGCGGWGVPVVGFGTEAQSPIAQTPGKS